MKKIYIIRPEIEVEYIKPIRGRLVLAANLWRFIKIKKFTLTEKSTGTKIGNFYVVAIAKIKKKENNTWI